jgi:hypothetical protein
MESMNAGAGKVTRDDAFAIYIEGRIPAHDRYDHLHRWSASPADQHRD